jgi:hypothetical protein
MKIYYTVEKEIIDNEYVTGIKTINIYKIDKNIPILLGEIKSASDDLGNYFKNSQEEISDYIDEFLPEYDTNNMEFIQL